MQPNRWKGLEYVGEQIDSIKGRPLVIYTDGLILILETTAAYELSHDTRGWYFLVADGDKIA